MYYTKKNYKLALCVYSLFALTIFATGARSAMLAFLLSSALMFGLLVWHKQIRLNISKFVMLVVLSVSLIVGGLGVYKLFDHLSGEDNFAYRMTTDSSNISAGRFAIWNFTLQKGLESPIIGYGPGSFRRLAENTNQKLAAKNHPHNFILEIFISTGILGLIAMSILGFYIFIDLLKRISSESYVAIFAVSSYTAYWVNSMVSVSILQTYWLAFFMICTVLGYIYIKNNQKQE